MGAERPCRPAKSKQGYELSGSLVWVEISFGRVWRAPWLAMRHLAKQFLGGVARNIHPLVGWPIGIEPSTAAATRMAVDPRALEVVYFAQFRDFVEEILHDEEVGWRTRTDGGGIGGVNG